MVCENVGQDEDQRNQQNYLSQKRQTQRRSGVAQGHKGLLTGILHAHHTDSCRINPHGPGSHGDVVWIRGEHMHENLRKQHGQRPQDHRIGDAAFEQIEKGAAHPVQFSGSVIVADDGLGSLGHAGDGQQRKLHHAGQHRHDAHGDIPAVRSQRHVKTDI